MQFLRLILPSKNIWIVGEILTVIMDRRAKVSSIPESLNVAKTRKSRQSPYPNYISYTEAAIFNIPLPPLQKYLDCGKILTPVVDRWARVSFTPESEDC